MTASLVQSKSGSNTSTTALALALSSNVAAGDMIVVSINVASTTEKISSVTSAGMTFTKIAAASGIDGGDGLMYLSTWYAFNCSAETAPTILINKSASAGIEAVLMHFTGVTTTDPLDKVAKGLGANTTAISSGATAALSQANEVVVGVGASDFGGASYTVGGGYSGLVQTSASAGDIAMQYKIVASTAAVTSTMTLNNATDNIGVALTFLIASSGSVALTGLCEFMTSAKPQAVFFQYISARSRSMNAGNALAALAAYLSARSIMQAKGKISGLFSLPISGRSSMQSKGRGNSNGFLALAAKSLAAFKGRGTALGKAALMGLAATSFKARMTGSFSLPLFGKGRASASAKDKITGFLILRGAAKSITKGRGVALSKISMSGNVMTMTKAKARSGVAVVLIGRLTSLFSAFGSINQKSQSVPAVVTLSSNAVAVLQLSENPTSTVSISMEE